VAGKESAVITTCNILNKPDAMYKNELYTASTTENSAESEEVEEAESAHL
jgi:hypothetical protein